MSNHWARSIMSYRCQPDTSSYSINAKPMGATLSAISVNMDTSSLVYYQRQTNGHDLVSYRCQPGHQILIDQSQTNGHDLSLYVSMRTKLLSSSNQIGVFLSTKYISSCYSCCLSTLERFYRETEFPLVNLESQIRAKKIPVSLPSSPIKMLCKSVQGFLIYDKILKIYISPLKWRK